MKKPENTISASEFKKHFLGLVDEVNKKHTSFIITKRKVPVAKVVPLEDKMIDKKSYFGSMKGTVKINDDIVNYSSELDWDVNND
jgi:prevent-host-death family protein